MNIKEVIKFDLRKTFLTKLQLEEWENNNILYNTLWFDINISAPDIEFSYISQRLFQINEKYSSWKIVPRKNGGYVLQNNNGLTITSDLMSGRWWFMKKLMGVKEGKNTRLELSPLYYKDIEPFRTLQGEALYSKLVEKYGYNDEIWESFISYLNVVYTIGNMTPAGSNPGGNGYDNWINKLEKLHKYYFGGKSYSDKSIINKWKPFLDKIYEDKRNLNDKWVSFITDNFFQPYVDPNFKVKEIDFNNLNDAIKKSYQMILNRGKLIQENKNYKNKNYNFIKLPYVSIDVNCKNNQQD